MTVYRGAAAGARCGASARPDAANGRPGQEAQPHAAGPRSPLRSHAACLGKPANEELPRTLSRSGALGWRGVEQLVVSDASEGCQVLSRLCASGTRNSGHGRTGSPFSSLAQIHARTHTQKEHSSINPRWQEQPWLHLSHPLLSSLSALASGAEMQPPTHPQQTVRRMGPGKGMRRVKLLQTANIRQE